MRHAAYTSGDEAPSQVGDDRWVGINSRVDPQLLPPAYLASAENVRMRTGQPTTRLGTVRPRWAHRLNEYGNPRSWGRFTAATNFRNPDGVAWTIFVEAEGVWRIKANNQPLTVLVPAYAGLPSTVSLTQAFNKLFLFRGRSLRPLVCDDLDVGFRDVVAPWDIAVAYDAGSLVAWGPWTTIGAGNLTCSGVTATLVYTADHGLVTGADITVSGAVQTAYNGRWKVTVVNDNTVTFTVGSTPTATPATGTVLASDLTYFWENASATSAGDEPGVTGWTRNHTVLPNGINATYQGNRLFVPTAYIPGQTTAEAGEDGSKADYLAATDVLDYRQFFLDSEFRINQGSADELQCVVKGSNNSLVCFKTESVYLLSGVSGDLSGLTLQEMKDVYGIVNGRAVTNVGKDLVFVSPKRGVVSLVQSVTGELQGADVPMSNDIQPVIDRISWQYGERIRLAWWDNKLYVAVPLDGGRAYGGQVVPRDVLNLDSNDPTRAFLYLDNTNQPYVLTVGQTYAWTPGDNATEVLVINGTPYEDATEFTYDGGAIWLRWEDALGAGSDIRPIYEGVNNAVLVYDYQLQAWQSVDSGPGICPEEFVVAKIHGRDRLQAFMADGTIAIYEASQDGDVQLNDLQEPIAMSVRTRGYNPSAGLWRGRRAVISVSTWAADWSASVVTEGVNEEQALLTNVTRDRTRYRQPITAAAFDPEESGAAFDRPYREDYSEVGPALAGWDVSTTGFIGDRQQVFRESVRIPFSAGDTTQLDFTNEDGVATLMAVEFELTATQRRDGSKV